MSFAARDGVCGDGAGNIRTSDGDHSFRGRPVWSSDCQPGPVRVAIEVRGGRAADLETFVGGSWVPRADALDLGTVEAPAAARLLLDLARTDRGEVGEDAIFPGLPHTIECIQKITESSTLAIMRTWLSWEMTKPMTPGSTEQRR